MQSIRLITSELTWCLRCSRRIGLKPKPLFSRSVSVPIGYQRPFSADTIPAAMLEGDDKTYTPKIHKLVQDISQLTLIEVADLNELLKKTLKIADAPIMAMGAYSAATKPKEEEEAPEVKQEKASFTVKITNFEESKKVALIKEVKSLVQGMNLVQAKKFVESLPQPIKQDVSKDEAEKLKVVLEAAGATVVLD